MQTVRARPVLPSRLFLAGLLTLSPGLAQDQDADYSIANQSPPTPPLALVPGDLDVRISVPGYEPFEFRAAAIDLPGYPESLFIPSSPLGFGGLLRDPASPVGDYLVDFELMGLPVPLSWDPALEGSSGTSGQVTVEVTVAPVAEYPDLDFSLQGPPGPGDPPKVSIKPAKDGKKDAVIISAVGSAECLYDFIQFVSVTITWKGTGADGKPTSGTGAGQHSNKPNGGQPMQTDGSTTYVDSPNLGGSGSYPHQNFSSGPGPNEVTQNMGDSPGLNDPKPFADSIEANNPGVTVTEITLTQRFTTYVIVECPPAAPKVVTKVEWSRSQTVPVNPDNTGPAGGPGGFGGPAAGPPAPGSPFTQGLPTAGPVTGMDPEHQQALNNFRNGNGSGAPTQGW